MEISLFTYSLATALTLVVSFFFTMLGLGGGILYVPIFKWLGFPVKAVAIPGGLLLNGLNTFLAFLRYTREGLVDFRGGTPIAVSAVVLAPVGAYLVRYIHHDALMVLFAIILLILGTKTIFTAEETETEKEAPLRRSAAVGSLVGGFAGLLGGLLGLGGGFIILPMLLRLGYPTKKAVATTSYIVTFSSFSGFLAHTVGGNIDVTLAILTVTAVLIGSQAGAWVMVKWVKSKWIRRSFGIVLLMVAAKLLHGLSSEE